MKQIKKQSFVILFILTCLFIPLFSANANMPMPSDDDYYIKFANRITYDSSAYYNPPVSFSTFLGRQLDDLVRTDLKYALISGFIELAILFLIFRKRQYIKKLKDAVIVIFVNVVSWLIFLGTTTFSGWYLASLFYDEILRYHYTVNYSHFIVTLIIMELLVILFESFIFTLILKNRYPKRKIWIGVILANIVSTLIGLLYFL